MSTPIKIFALVVLALGVAVPVWAIDKEGAESASPNSVSEEDEDAKRLFVQNCGTCHALDKAGTDGVVGPNLDTLLGAAPGANEERVFNAIVNGVQGAMPAGIVPPEAAREIAKWVNEATAPESTAPPAAGG